MKRVNKLSRSAKFSNIETNIEEYYCNKTALSPTALYSWEAWVPNKNPWKALNRWEWKSINRTLEGRKTWDGYKKTSNLEIYL